jgi:hypothetical protein
VYFLVFSTNSNTDDYHIDNEAEAATFINTHVRNSSAFVVYIGSQKLEQDCTGVAGSNSFYEFRYCFTSIIVTSAPNTNFDMFRFLGPSGVVMCRKYPCFCNQCKSGLFHMCINLAYVGCFEHRTMRALAMREQNAHFNDDMVAELHTILLAIVGCCVYLGKIQYEVQWHSQNYTT